MLRKRERPMNARNNWPHSIAGWTNKGKRRGKKDMTQRHDALCPNTIEPTKHTIHFPLVLAFGCFIRQYATAGTWTAGLPLLNAWSVWGYCRRLSALQPKRQVWLVPRRHNFRHWRSRAPGSGRMQGILLSAVTAEKVQGRSEAPNLVIGKKM